MYFSVGAPSVHINMHQNSNEHQAKAKTGLRRTRGVGCLPETWKPGAAKVRAEEASIHLSFKLRRGI